MLLSRFLRKFVVVIISITIFVMLIGGVLFLTPYKNLESFSNSSYSIRIKDVNGVVLYVTSLEDGLKRIRVLEDDIPSKLKSVIVRSEDRYFYYHLGVNPVAVVRTLFYRFKTGRVVSGASTITMQLARIITPRDKSLRSKFLEIIDSFRLESKLSKSEILSLYLSFVPFGKNMEGYGSASLRYFGKEFKDLNIAEVEILSIIPRSPTLYDPINNRAAVESAIIRDGLLSDEIKNNFKDSLDNISSRRNLPLNPIKAPHFVNYVVSNLDDEVYKLGKDIETTLDLEIQTEAVSILNRYLEESADKRLTNGAILLTYEGSIVAYVGSRDFFDTTNHGQIDGVQILRQPGSTLKPFLYELALEVGFTPGTTLPDIPTIFGKKEAYIPENYSQTFNGPIRLRTALASSLNIPAVYTLERVGVDNFIERLKELGFISLIGQEKRLGLGLAVGNAEVSLYELVRGFRAFKNSGLYQDLNFIQGREADTSPVMNKIDADLIRDILSDNKSRVLGFGRNSVLNTPYPSYFKTGTSNQFNNIWALGATEDFTCGVWMGNFSGATVIGTPGSSIPAKIARKLLDDLSSKRDFNPLEGVIKETICSLSGELATNYCPVTTTEYFKDVASLGRCSFHSKGGKTKLPDIYNEWLTIYSYDNFGADFSTPKILSPKDGSIFFYTPNAPLDNQGVEFKLTGTGDFKVLSSGSLILEGDLPFQGVISIPKGKWYLSIVLNDNAESRFIEIR